MPRSANFDNLAARRAVASRGSSFETAETLRRLSFRVEELRDVATVA